MDQSSSVAPGSRDGWDHVVEQLQALRVQAGTPSYAEICRLVGARRQQAGATVEASRVARTTVYDAFRTGRARIDLSLVREIAAVLGAEDGLVDDWVRGPRQESPRPVLRLRLALMVACVLLNLAGRVLVDVLHLPVYLDMVGTAIAAIALGPWRGAVVGGATNTVAVLTSGWISIPFGLVNVAGALVWGHGVRRWGMGRTLLRFFALNVVVAVVCTLVAVPILLLNGGSVGQGQDTITSDVMRVFHDLQVAVGLSNILTSIGDKLLSGFVVLVVVSALPTALRGGLELVASQPSAR